MICGNRNQQVIGLQEKPLYLRTMSVLQWFCSPPFSHITQQGWGRPFMSHRADLISHNKYMLLKLWLTFYCRLPRTQSLPLLTLNKNTYLKSPKLLRSVVSCIVIWCCLWQWEDSEQSTVDWNFVSKVLSLWGRPQENKKQNQESHRIIARFPVWPKSWSIKIKI